ncbi:TonB-dependent receptor plug domain-containing protein [Sphingobium tyrosinilyticum]|uniref:TonB-dependent receptor plug domain-containing protein n=1 Tax=Sphingobium tyrosinilyticum TaxID=2715436 RepID=A0ABV9F0L3_9SPHN
MMNKSLARLLATASLIYCAPGLAQDVPSAEQDAAATSNVGVSDIVVTAQRRVERIQDVPIAIAVVSGEQLNRQQVVEVRDLARTTASLQFGPAGDGAQGGGGMIRGIGTFGFVKGSEAAVGIVVDGVVQGNTNITNLFDIARVEVLRGQQGTLFGSALEYRQYRLGRCIVHAAALKIDLRRQKFSKPLLGGSQPEWL